jgi:type IV pilus assembly protein PilX
MMNTNHIMRPCIASRNLSKNNLNAKTQAGVVMLITLMSLVILTFASVALIRSTDANLLIAGNLAFKRDVINQAERAIPAIKAKLETGTLASATVRQADLASSNYYAVIQTNNSNGIPNVLMDVADNNTNNITDTNAQIIVRYVIDRMCLSSGVVSTTGCSLSQSSTDSGGDANNDPEKAKGMDIPIYRISIRATGPRNTEAFLQSSFQF